MKPVEHVVPIADRARPHIAGAPCVASTGA